MSADLKDVILRSDILDSNLYELIVEFKSTSFRCYTKTALNMKSVDDYKSVPREFATKDLSDEQEVLLKLILQDLINTLKSSGNANHLIAAKPFLSRWDVKKLRSDLKSYGVTNKLPLDRALNIIDEVYVSQIMES